jgi:hypothetical protein
MVKDGKGELKYFFDKSVYRGEFKMNERFGRGEHLLKNGDKYSGEWVNDMKHGFGKLESLSTKSTYYG